MDNEVNNGSGWCSNMGEAFFKAFKEWQRVEYTKRPNTEYYKGDKDDE